LLDFGDEGRLLVDFDVSADFDFAKSEERVLRQFLEDRQSGAVVDVLEVSGLKKTGGERKRKERGEERKKRNIRPATEKAKSERTF
jgi:hypothetical protein